MADTKYSDLNGKVAVITGASGAIGSALVRTLLANGVTVVASDLSADSLKDVFGDLHSLIDFRSLDVTNADATHELAQAVKSKFGRLDVWINNAGIIAKESALDYKASTWQKTLDVNLSGTFYGAQAAARVMVAQKSGVILNLSSYAGIRARHRCPDYTSTKAAVAHLTRSLASEWGPLGVRVNALAPGFIDSPMTTWLRDDAEALARFVEKTPARRLGTPEDIAQAALYLCSDVSSFVTGHVLVIDGGLSQAVV